MQVRGKMISLHSPSLSAQATLYPVLSTNSCFCGYELGIIFSGSFSYISTLFLQAVLNLLFSRWNIYAHICHILSYLPSFIAARSPSLVSLNFKDLYPNHLIKSVFNICPSAIWAWSAWPLNHQLPLFYQTGFRLSTFILRHLNSVFLQSIHFSLSDWDLLKLLGHLKMKECIWVNIQMQQLPNSHWESFSLPGWSTLWPCRLLPPHPGFSFPPDRSQLPSPLS